MEVETNFISCGYAARDNYNVKTHGDNQIQRDPNNPNIRRRLFFGDDMDVMDDIQNDEEYMDYHYTGNMDLDN